MSDGGITSRSIALKLVGKTYTLHIATYVCITVTLRLK